MRPPSNSTDIMMKPLEKAMDSTNMEKTKFDLSELITLDNLILTRDAGVYSGV